MNRSREKLVRGAGRLLLELVVVFIGVYLAFMLNERGAEREREARRAQLRAALASEIAVFLEGADGIAPHFDSLYVQWQQRFEAGEQPAPLQFQLAGISLPPRGMWQAVVASDAVATLDIATMQRVSDYYNALDVMLEKFTALEAFAQREIIPYTSVPAEAFYDADGQLKPAYAAYMRRIYAAQYLLGFVREMAAESREKLVEAEAE